MAPQRQAIQAPCPRERYEPPYLIAPFPCIFPERFSTISIGGGGGGGGKREKLYFSLFIALKHLLLCYVVQGNLASHIHKPGCFGFNCVANLSYKMGSGVAWEDFQGRSK